MNHGTGYPSDEPAGPLRVPQVIGQTLDGQLTPAGETGHMRLDIEALTEAELVDLNNRVVARLRFLAEERAHSRMIEFRIGERVAFEPPDRSEVRGTLTRYNRKSVTVVTDDGQRWNVAPNALRRLEAATSSHPSVLPLRNARPR